MIISNNQTDISIDKCTIDKIVEKVVLDAESLSQEDLPKYTAFFNRFDKSKYQINGINDFEVVHFIESEVQDDNIILEYSELSTEDKSIVDNFITLTT